MKKFKTIAVGAVLASFLAGCAAHNPKMWEPAKAPKATPVTAKLNALPPSGQRAAVAVYNFTDQTGQFKPTDGAQTLSRAVTQGATSILVKTLHEAGNRQWFTVVERERLENLLRERAVIREMRASYLGETKINPQALPPLLFAGVLLEGGIIGYDSNTKTGGSGARLLGIGGRTQYREDTVTVYLRAVSVKTGEVLASVSSRKSIASVAVGADAFRFVAFRELLELEAGVTYNEPDELALRQAIEASVYSLIMEGAMQDLWCFDSSEQEVTQLLTQYVADRDSIPDTLVDLPRARNGGAVVGLCGTQKVARQAMEQARQAPAVNQGARPAPQGGAPVRPAPSQTPRQQSGVGQPALQQMSAPVDEAAARQISMAVEPDADAQAIVRVPLRAPASASVPAFARASVPAPAPAKVSLAYSADDLLTPQAHPIAAASFADWSGANLAQCSVDGLTQIAAMDLVAELARRAVDSGNSWIGGAKAFEHFVTASRDNHNARAIVRVSLERENRAFAARTHLSGRSVRDATITALEHETVTQDQPFNSAAIAVGEWLSSLFEEEKDTIRIELRRS